MAGHVFILGGTGQIGRALVLRFLSGGWRVTVASRGGKAGRAGTAAPSTTARGDAAADDVPVGASQVTCDRNDPGAVSRALRDGADVLVDVVAMTAEHSRQIIDNADCLGSVIAISTGSVYTDSEGRYFDTADDDESFPRYPVPIPESQITVRPGGPSYSPSKSAMEQTLLANAPVPVTILRPWAVHGPWSRSPREWWVVKRILDGRRFIPLARGGRSRFHTTSVDNLAELAWLSAVTPKTRVLNAADPEALTVQEITDTIVQAMAADVEVLTFEGTADEVGAAPWSVPYDVVADMTAAQEQLGYRPVMSYRSAVLDTVRWLQESVSPSEWQKQLPGLSAYDTDLFDYAAEDRWHREQGA